MNRFVSLIVLLAMFCVNCFSMNVSQYSDDGFVEGAPRIIRVYGDTITSGTIPPAYNYSFVVDYEGADYIQVGVEQEFSYDYSTFCVFEPKIAHVTVKDIQKRGKAWIDISAENEFGSTKMTIELPPYGNSESDGIEDVEVRKDESVARIAVYSVNGTFIANIHDISELSNLNRKIVILKYMNAENKVIKTNTIKQ